MPYAGSYLWRLRQAIGNDLVLMPGAMIALQRDDGRILLTKRADDGTWCLPAGAAEAGGSFAQTAIEELKEETGVEVAENDLIPSVAYPKPRPTRSTTQTETSPTASPSVSWRRSGRETLAPTAKSQPKSNSSNSTALPAPFTHPPRMHLSY